MRLNWSPQLTRHLIASGVFADDRFSLVDVGCSGGLPQQWRHFGGQLQAIGFDPLVREVERLNAVEENGGVEYVAARVGCGAKPGGAAPENLFDSTSYARCTTMRVVELRQLNYAAAYFDQTHDGAEIPAEAGILELDEYFRARPRNVDFLKTDTDGFDIEALWGAREMLSGDVVGAAVEVQLQGSLAPGSNVFANVERYLHERGYSLFAIDPKLHSRAALPKKFRWNEPADTHEGQVHWADTLFLRDVCLPDYEAHWGLQLSARKLLKLCCVHEIHGLEDCAAEILLRFRERIAFVADVDHCLNLLTPPLPDGRKVSHREYIEFFEKNVEAFYSGK